MALSIFIVQGLSNQITSEEFTQKIDHFDPNSELGTFQQRYFVDTTFAKNPDPDHLIIYLGSNYEFSERDIEIGPITRYANVTKSVLIELEHRFFGKSQPFSEQTVDNLAYLTIDQAIEDITDFISFSKSKYCTPNCTITIIGGQYFGALATWFRSTHPHLANSAWVSSGTLNLTTDFYGFDYQISRNYFIKNKKCLSNLQSITSSMHSTISNGSSSEKNNLKTLFNYASNTDDISFLYQIATFIARPVQFYQKTDLITSFCNSASNGKPDSQFAGGLKVINDYFNEKPGDYDPLTATGNFRSLLWLKCTSIGLFKTSYSSINSSQSLRSPWVNMTYFDRVCLTLFNQTASLNVSGNKFDQLIDRVTKTVFVTGSLDPNFNVTIHNNHHEYSQKSFIIKNGLQCNDLDKNVNMDIVKNNEVRKVDEQIFKQLNIWGNKSRCIHGKPMLGQCKCDYGYIGNFCNQKVVPEYAFKTVSVMTLAIPTALVLFLAVIVCIVSESSDFKLISHPAYWDY